MKCVWCFSESFDVVLRGSGFSGSKRTDNILCFITVNQKTYSQWTTHTFHTHHMWYSTCLLTSDASNVRPHGTAGQHHLWSEMWYKVQISVLLWKVRVMTSSNKQWLLFIDFSLENRGDIMRAGGREKIYVISLLTDRREGGHWEDMTVFYLWFLLVFDLFCWKFLSLFSLLQTKSELDVHNPKVWAIKSQAM